MVHPTASMQMEPSEDLETVEFTRTDTAGATYSITLTAQDIFSLAPKMSQFAARLAAEQHKEILVKDPDLRVQYTLETIRGETNVDLHNQKVILSIQDALDQWM